MFPADLGFAVAFGVPLDTFIVRTVLVPAFAYDIGPTIWWPSSKPANRSAGPEDRAATAHPTSSRCHDRDNTNGRAPIGEADPPPAVDASN